MKVFFASLLAAAFAVPGGAWGAQCAADRRCPPPARTLEEAVALCRRTYGYVAKSLPAERMKVFAAELTAVEQRAGKAQTRAERATTEAAVRALRRRILFAHPDLQFAKILGVQREIPYSEYNHEVDQYLGRLSQPGPGLVVIENWQTKPTKKVLLEGKLPHGCVFNPDLHWDGDRILFAFCDHTRKATVDPKTIKVPPIYPNCKWPDMNKIHLRYFLYECAVDGSWVRQLTGCPGDPMTTVEGRQTTVIEDADPCYLPDGGILFNSTRCQSFGRCHWGRYTPSFLLYRAELPPIGATGPVRDIRPYTFGEANEWEPSVMTDGRILYTRWDYIDRDSTWLQSLWTAHPDGTAVAHVYGSYSRCLVTPSEAKSVPGSPLIVCTAGAHHMVTGGSLVLIDPRKGEDGLEPLTRMTPEICFPEAEGWKFPGYYTAPMPVNDTLFFASYTDCLNGEDESVLKNRRGTVWPKPGSTSVWLVDTLGGRELIFKDPEHSTFNPIPLVKRPKPPALTSQLPPRETAPDWGVCYVENCYDSRADIPKGSIAGLRINRIFNQPAPRRHTPSPKVGHWGAVDQALYKESLGVVPVAKDGSAAFRIPAGLPIQLQAVDTNGMAVLTMRSFIYSQKGEIQGCTGCHEDKRLSRGVTRLPAGRTVSIPKPEINLGYHGPFSYTRSVQPIFDRKCISCHGLGKAPNFIGFEGLKRLRKDRQVALVRDHLPAADIAHPFDFYAAASPLTKRLQNGHGPWLSRDEWRTLILWMDFNVPQVCYNGYSWNQPEFREVDPSGEAALRAAVEKCLGKTIAGQPFDALVNRGDETKSRVLWLAKPSDRAHLLDLCKKALKPLPAQDIQGTCGRDDACECHSCWVRRGGYNKPLPLPKK